MTGEQLLAAQAMRLLMRLDSELFRGTSPIQSGLVSPGYAYPSESSFPTKRRSAKLDPPLIIPLGTLRRRYHASLAKYLYEPTR